MRAFLWSLGGLFIVLVCLLGLLPRLLSSGRGNELVERLLSGRLGVPVEAERLSFSWTGRQSVVGLRVGSPEGFPHEEDLLRAGRADLLAGILDLLDPNQPLRLDLDRPVVHLRRNKEGRTNFQVLAGGPRKDRGTRDRPRRERTGELSPRTLAVHLAGGEISYHDEMQGASSRLSALKGEMEVTPTRFELRATGDVAHSGPAGKDTGRMDLDARLRAEPGTAGEGLNGTGRIDFRGPIAYQGYTLETLGADLRLEGGELRVSNGAMGLNGGRVTAEEVVVGLEAAPTPYRVKMRVEDVAANYDMSPVLAFLVPFLALEHRQAEMTGKINASLELKGEGFALEELERSLKGKGTFRMADGKVSASKFFGELARFLGGDLASVLFAELGSDFQIGSGSITNEKVFLTGKEGSKVRGLGLKGTTYFDKRIDYGVELATLEETIGDRKIRGILDDIQKALGEGAVLPLKLRGSLESPRLALDPGLPELKPPDGAAPDLRREVEERLRDLMEGR